VAADNTVGAVVVIDGAGSEIFATNYIAFGGNETVQRGTVDVTISDGGKAHTLTTGSGNFLNFTGSVLRLDSGHIATRYYHNTGVTKGSGTIYSGTETRNAGTIAPGIDAAAGKITVTNKFELWIDSGFVGGGVTDAGILDFSLGGTNPVTEHDVLEVVGNVELSDGASLHGTVDVGLINGFEPPAGVTTYDVLTATGTITPGDLANITFNMPTAPYTTWTQSVETVTGGEVLRITATMIPPPQGTMVIIR
jgi:hypothetical protein